MLDALQLCTKNNRFSLALNLLKSVAGGEDKVPFTSQPFLRKFLFFAFLKFSRSSSREHIV